GRVSSDSIHPGVADSGSNVDLGNAEHSERGLAVDSNEPLVGSDSSIDLGSAPEMSARESDEGLADELGGRPEPEEEAGPVAATRGGRPTPAPRPTAPSEGSRGWVGWAGGALAGVGASVALWVFGVQPPAGMRLFGDDGKKPAALNVSNPSVNPVANDAVAQ